MNTIAAITGKLIFYILKITVYILHFLAFMEIIAFPFSFIPNEKIELIFDSLLYLIVLAMAIYLILKKKFKKTLQKIWLAMTFITPLLCAISFFFVTRYSMLVNHPTKIENETLLVSYPICFLVAIISYFLLLILCILNSELKTPFLAKIAVIKYILKGIVTVGYFYEPVISLLKLDVNKSTLIYITKSNVEHIKEKHLNDYNKYKALISDIIQNADYIGKDAEDGSIEFTKEYAENSEFVKVAVRPTSANTYFIRTMYIVDKERVKYLEEKGELIKIR